MKENIYIIIILCLIFLAIWLFKTEIATGKEVCRNFKTQQEAQAKYNKYINTGLSKYVKDLDRDQDTIACESLT